MKHFEYELHKNFEKKTFVNKLNEAKSEIAHLNGPVEFELEEILANKKFNDFTGVFQKHRILQKGNLIGFLECFQDNNSEYFIIYTSNTN